MTLSAVQWACAIVAAVMVGIAKTAISGLSALNVALLAYVFPSSKQATGFILPMLIFADCIAVHSYRRHTQWPYLWKLFPWTGLGVVLGYVALGRISGRGRPGRRRVRFIGAPRYSSASWPASSPWSRMPRVR
jgi:uncharacterized membrane protein YfcA